MIPLLEDLERRGLVRLDDRRRYSVLGGIGAQLRRTDGGLAGGDRLLGFFTALARGGTVSGEDVAAVLGSRGGRRPAASRVCSSSCERRSRA